MSRPRIDVAGEVAIVELAEPEKLNPLGQEVLEALEEIVLKLRNDGDVRVLVLRGQGPSFSAGADLRQWPPPDDPWQQQRARRSRWQRLLEDIETLPQVSVAILRGHVIGGAALLALSCDLRIASETLALRIPELALGIPLTWAGLPRLVREIGLPRTRDLVLTGREIGAAEALDWGLVTRTTSEERLNVVADEVVSSVLAPPFAVTAMTRQSLAAIGRDRMTAAAWADVDVYLGAIAREESAEARRRYTAKLR